MDNKLCGNEADYTNTPPVSEKTTLFTVMTTSFMITFMASSINLALPAMGKDFGCDAVTTSWILTAYILASALFILPFGRFADIKGRRKIYLIGTLVFAVFTLLIPLANTAGTAIVLRIIQGIGASMTAGTGMAILTSVFPPQKRGMALGYSVSVTYLGLSVGPVVGGMMNHYLGWSSIFYVSGALGLIAAFVIFTRLKGEWLGAPGEKFDKTGSLLYIAGMVGLLYGLSSVESSRWAAAVIAAGIILLVVFARWENRVQEPMLKIQVFRNNLTFTMSNLAALINYSATFAVTFLLSVYLQVVKGYNSQTAGFILLAQPLMMALLSPLAGTLSDRMEPQKVASIGMACTALCLFCFSLIQKDTSIMMLVGILILAGIGFALFSSPNNNAVMSSVEMRFYGIASSVLGTMRVVGQAISMSIVTMLMAVFLGGSSLVAADPDQLLKTVRISFMVFTVLSLLGIAASLARGKVHASGQTPAQPAVAPGNTPPSPAEKAGE